MYSEYTKISVQYEKIYKKKFLIERNKHLVDTVHYSTIYEGSKLIKTGDILHNPTSTFKYDKSFVKVYIKECIDITKSLGAKCYYQKL